MIADHPFFGLQPKHYGAIVADPPWSFRSYTPGSDRNADRHYSTMSVEEIAALPVKDLAAADCHLFLWATGPHLPSAFKVMKAWGFAYSGIGFTWVKLKRRHNGGQLSLLSTAEGDLHVGLGYTTRKNAEFCLLGRRGNARRAAKDVREVILAPVREHSRKPDEFYSRVERYVGPVVPKLELFARERRPFWMSWGNQTEHFKSWETADAIIL